MEFVALFGCRDINASRLYRLSASRSCFRYIVQSANKIAYFKGKMEIKQFLYKP